jgi:hypothetical protein
MQTSARAENRGSRDDPRGTNPSLGKNLALAVLGLALIWQIATVSVPNSLVTQTPETALSLAPGAPTALAALARQKLETLIADAENTKHDKGVVRAAADYSGRFEEIRTLAERAIVASPLDAEAFRILGATSPQDVAADFMRASLRRSIHETDTLLWLMQQGFAAGRYAETARIANILLLVRPQLLPAAMPILAQMAEKKEAVNEIDRLMAARPRWRDSFLNDLVLAVRDARTPLRVFLPLRETPFPPTNESLGRYIGFLLQHRLYTFAYDVWRSFLPAQQLEKTGLLFNGGFEAALSGLPFDWVITRGDATTIEVVAQSDNPGRRALSIAYGSGRSSPHGVSQFVRLAPGSYRMTGRYSGGLVGRRGLRWQVSCIDGSAALGESDMALGVARDWKTFAFDFTVPAENCLLQQVKLGLAARSPSEWLVSGRLLYADLAIEPLGQTAVAPAK